jgi:hypothetical protein
LASRIDFRGVANLSNLKSEVAIAAPLLLSRKINDLEAQLALFL